MDAASWLMYCKVDVPNEYKSKLLTECTREHIIDTGNYYSTDGHCRGKL